MVLYFQRQLMMSTYFICIMTKNSGKIYLLRFSHRVYDMFSDVTLILNKSFSLNNPKNKIYSNDEQIIFDQVISVWTYVDFFLFYFYYYSTHRIYVQLFSFSIRIQASRMNTIKAAYTLTNLSLPFFLFFFFFFSKLVCPSKEDANEKVKFFFFFFLACISRSVDKFFTFFTRPEFKKIK